MKGSGCASVETQRIVLRFEGTCAPAPNGYAVAAPSPAMKCLRLFRSPDQRGRAARAGSSGQGLGRSMATDGILDHLSAWAAQQGPEPIVLIRSPRQPGAAAKVESLVRVGGLFSC